MILIAFIFLIPFMVIFISIMALVEILFNGPNVPLALKWFKFLVLLMVTFLLTMTAGYALVDPLLNLIPKAL